MLYYRNKPVYIIKDEQSFWSRPNEKDCVWIKEIICSEHLFSVERNAVLNHCAQKYNLTPVECANSELKCVYCEKGNNNMEDIYTSFNSVDDEKHFAPEKYGEAWKDINGRNSDSILTKKNDTYNDIKLKTEETQKEIIDLIKIIAVSDWAGIYKEKAMDILIKIGENNHLPSGQGT